MLYTYIFCAITSPLLHLKYKYQYSWTRFKNTWQRERLKNPKKYQN